MAGNNVVDVWSQIPGDAMDSQRRARYEQQLATSIRGLRGAETQLRLCGSDDAADELALLRGWLQSCVVDSLQGKSRMTLTSLCRGVAAAAQTSLDTRS